MKTNDSWLLLSCLWLSLFTQLATASTLEQLTGISNTHSELSGVSVLEKGESSLMARAWLTEQASASIHVQYFIWSTDNIGTLASEALLRAADRGVQVKVIVDDLMIDAEPRTLLSLAAHPNVIIKIYNPKHSVGVSFLKRLWYLISDFRNANQRMHDKSVIFDGAVAITGGRNMADEYYDYHQQYNFRDRDVLLTGAVVAQMEQNFQQFWNSPLSVPLQQQLADEQDTITTTDIQTYRQWLHSYAQDPENYAPEVLKARESMANEFPKLIEAMSWSPVTFISDYPGKNSGDEGLAGGGESSSALIELVKSARQSITIQSPYLVLPEGGLELFRDLIKRGVQVRISTNSMISTDNLYAFSGYYKQRPEILDAGIEVFEYKTKPAIMRSLINRYPALEKNPPIFAVHAKSLVVDGKRAYIGTFNLDPRSTHLNTEVGVIINDAHIARQVERAIETDMSAGNSWSARQYRSDDYPGDDASLTKRISLWFWSLLPLEPLL